MNIFVTVLAEGSPGILLQNRRKLVVEDNVGEGIHIHIRNVRFDMSIEDYLAFADGIEKAAEVVD